MDLIAPDVLIEALSRYYGGDTNTNINLIRSMIPRTETFKGHFNEEEEYYDDEDGHYEEYSPLRLALVAHDYDMAETLVNNGQRADIELFRPEMYSSGGLEWLVRHSMGSNLNINYPSIISLLIRDNAPNYDLIDEMMLKYISKNPKRHKMNLMKRLGATAVQENDDIIIQMLIDHGVDVDNIKIYGRSGTKVPLLFQAITNESLEVAELLSTEGREYNPNFTERRGLSLKEALKNLVNNSEDGKRWAKILERVEKRSDKLVREKELELYDALRDNNYDSIEDLIGSLGYEPKYLVGERELTAAEVAYEAYKLNRADYDIAAISFITLETGDTSPAHKVYFRSIKDDEFAVFDRYADDATSMEYDFDVELGNCIMEYGSPRFIKWLSYHVVKGDLVLGHRIGDEEDLVYAGAKEFVEYYGKLIEARRSKFAPIMLEQIPEKEEAYYSEMLVNHAIKTDNVAMLYSLASNGITMDNERSSLMVAIENKASRTIIGTLIRLGADIHMIDPVRTITPYELSSKDPQLRRLFDEYRTTVRQRVPLTPLTVRPARTARTSRTARTARRTTEVQDEIEELLEWNESVAGSSLITPESISELQRWKLPIAKY